MKSMKNTALGVTDRGRWESRKAEMAFPILVSYHFFTPMTRHFWPEEGGAL